MKLINKQYGIRETEELFRVYIGVMQQNMLVLLGGYACEIFTGKEIENQAITNSDFVKWQNAFWLEYAIFYANRVPCSTFFIMYFIENYHHQSRKNKNFY